MNTKHPYLFLAALMPSPPEEFRVHPDYQVLATLAERIASSLSTVLLLGTYGLLSFDHWSKLIPLYMDAIRNINLNAEEQKGLGTFLVATNAINNLQHNRNIWNTQHILLIRKRVLKRFQRKFFASFWKMNYPQLLLMLIKLGPLRRRSIRDSLY